MIRVGNAWINPAAVTMIDVGTQRATDGAYRLTVRTMNGSTDSFYTNKESVFADAENLALIVQAALKGYPTDSIFTEASITT